ncbi:MAG: hypothetical protein AAFX99_07735 [Myxococcota bacterium]
MNKTTMRWMGVLAVLLLFLSTGCYRTVLENPSASTGGATISMTNNHFLFGLAGTSQIPVKSMCPNGVKRIENVRTFGDGFLGVLTFGIYTPHTTRLTCAGGSAFLLGRDEDGEVMQVIDISGTELATVNLGAH